MARRRTEHHWPAYWPDGYAYEAREEWAEPTSGLPPALARSIARYGSVSAWADTDPNAYELAYDFAGFDAEREAAAAMTAAYRAELDARNAARMARFYAEQAERRRRRREWQAAGESDYAQYLAAVRAALG